jgi:hypothetical protein
MPTAFPRRFSRFLPILLFLLAAGLFLIANRPAHHSFFTEDEIDNLAFTRHMDNLDFLLAMFSPRYFDNNFRPVGHFFFRTMAHAQGLNFPPYALFMQLVHLANLALLWLVLRRLALPFRAAVAGALFFAFNMAVFDIYWKPMYVFDLLCATFCLLCLFFWLGDRWILSVLCFWVAYRCKEVAVMLPIALVAGELLLGKRRWLRLIPFFVISLWFGIHGLLATKDPHGYVFHYDLANLWRAVLFYSSRLVLLPYDGLVLLPILLLLPLLAPPLLRDRFVWFGTITAAALLLPMLLLSDRLFGAYLYVPLIGLSIVIAATAAHQRTAAIVLFFALWIPWNYANLRWLRREALSQAEDRHRYVNVLGDIARDHPYIHAFLYRDGGPLQDWGARSAVQWFHPLDTILLAREDSPAAAAILQKPALAVLYWNEVLHRLRPVIRTPASPDVGYLEIGPYVPAWQLETGWLPSAGAARTRWTRPHAVARLLRPAGVTEFEFVANVSPLYIGALHRSHVALLLDGKPLGAADFDHSGVLTVRWNLPPAPSGPVEITFDTSPPYNPSDPLGIAVVAFGFVPKPEPSR